MINNLGIVFGIIAVLMLHIKTYLYYKLKNPNKSIFIAYVRGEIIYYFMMALLPIKIKNYAGNSYVNKLNYLTYLFYFFALLSFGLGYVGYLFQISYLGFKLLI